MRNGARAITVSIEEHKAGGLLESWCQSVSRSAQTRSGALLDRPLAHLRTSIATIASMSERSSAGHRAGDSLVAEALVTPDPFERQKRSLRVLLSAR
jgi:hypothetical protein